MPKKYPPHPALSPGSGGKGKSGGENSLQAFLTGFCPLAKILKAMGVEAGEVFRV
jgi:hypothetical protein